MSRLTRDGTAEPVSRDQILRHVRGHRGMFIFPVPLTTSRIGNLTRLIHTLLYVMTIHTYIHTLATCMAIHYVQFHLKYDPPHTHKAERGAHDAVVFERDFEEGVSPLSHLMRGFGTTAVIDPLLGGTSTRTLDWLGRQGRIARSCATGQINTHTQFPSLFIAPSGERLALPVCWRGTSLSTICRVFVPIFLSG